MSHFIVGCFWDNSEWIYSQKTVVNFFLAESTVYAQHCLINSFGSQNYWNIAMCLVCSRIILSVWMFRSSALCKRYMYRKESIRRNHGRKLVANSHFFVLAVSLWPILEMNFSHCIDFVNFSKKICRWNSDCTWYLIQHTIFQPIINKVETW